MNAQRETWGSLPVAGAREVHDGRAMNRLTSARQLRRALRVDRELAHRETWDRDRLEALQRERLRALIAHAVGASPFYREFYGDHGVGPDTPLEALPVLDKPTLMAHWDDAVTDRRLRLADAREAIERHDGWLHGHQVMATGGSSRVPGVFAFDRAAWDQVCGQALRANRWAGLRPRPGRRIHVAGVYAPSGRHLAARVTRQLDVGLLRITRIPATLPIAEMTARLEAAGAGALNGYAGVIGTLAGEACDGRLSIAPRVVVASSEPLTPAIRERVRAAWGVEPSNWYATTEAGVTAVDCEHHEGLHVFEDQVLLEPQDERVLTTNLVNRLLPLIRLAVDDLVRWEPGPCPCGRTLRRLATVDGRADDVLTLPGRLGAPVPVHPTAWADLPALPCVGDFEIVQRGTEVLVRVTARGDAEAAHHAVTASAGAALDGVGVSGVRLTVEVVEQLHRHDLTGKRKVVRVEQPLPAGV